MKENEENDLLVLLMMCILIQIRIKSKEDKFYKSYIR